MIILKKIIFRPKSVYINSYFHFKGLPLVNNCSCFHHTIAQKSAQNRLYRDYCSKNMLTSTQTLLNNQMLKGSLIETKSYSTDDKVEKKDETKTLTASQKLKKAVSEYGSTVIVFHVTMSLISLGTCYLLVSTGLDIEKVFEYFGMQQPKFVNNAGTFAVAYAFHKVFAPVRMGITLTAVPFIVRYLRKNGFLKK